MHAIDIAIGVGWLVFWVGWLVAAVGVKSGRAQWRPYAGSRVVVIVAIILLARVHAFRGHDTHDAWLEGIGLAAFVLGLALAVWARVYLGRNWGTPMSQKDSPELVTTGPYRWIRNPIYSGLILAGIGSAVAISPEWFVVVVVVGGFFVYSAFKEQEYMSAQFPHTYPAYRNSTKMLIPYVF